ncbi:MAG TPA: hypothetical protein DCR27_07865 [Lachnospiraceae bacterium]|nr:hypothetical protein [Lachnospiraceae bacterium]
MQIAVCDDIQKELKLIRTALDTYTETHPEYHFDIDEYRSADDILYAVEKGKTYDIALLDICMPDVLGTDVAEKMLAQNPNTGVVFLTTSDEYAITAYAMNAVHYLLKPFLQEQFNEALDRAVRKTKEQDFLSLACMDGVYRVCVGEIIFIESQDHYLMIHLSSGATLRLRRKLSQMFKEIHEYPEFIRVGASYIVNLTFVRQVAGNTLEIANGAKIPIPRRSSKEVKKTYMDFCRKEVLK